MSLSIVNKKMRKMVEPFLRSYIIDSFECLSSKSEVTLEYLSAFRLRREEPYTSLKKIYSQFMPDLEMSKFLCKKLIIPRNYRLLAPIIRRRLERTIRTTEDENRQDVNIIENSIRSMYIDNFKKVKNLSVLGPSFGKFCNFIDDIYGIYSSILLDTHCNNLTIFAFKLPNFPVFLIRTNIIIF